MKLLWLTDLHLVAEGDLLHGVDPAERFGTCLKAALQSCPDADRVIVTGDIAHSGAAGGYECLEGIVRDCAIPFRLLPGNHDDAGRFPPGIGGEARVFIDRARRERLKGWNLLYLDTSASQNGACGLDDEQLQWLAGELATDDGCPSMLFLHHPPFPTGIPAIDSEHFQNREAMRRVLADAPRLLHMFCGHCHRNISGSWSGVPFTALASTHLSFSLNLSTKRLSPRQSNPEFAIIIGGAGSVAVHVSELAAPPAGGTD